MCEIYGDLENDTDLRNFTEVEKLHDGACGKNSVFVVTYKGREFSRFGLI